MITCRMKIWSAIGAACFLLLWAGLQSTHAQAPQQVVTLQRDVKPTTLGVGMGELTVTFTLTTNSAVCPVPPVTAKPMDAVLVIDHSGSMGDILGLSGIGGGTKLENAKKAAKEFLANVLLDRSKPNTDQIAITQFDDAADVLQTLSTDRGQLERAIDSIRIGGGTAIHAGMDAGRAELQSARVRQSAVPVIILLTDGQSDEDVALAAAETAKKAGIRVVTIGLGRDVNAPLLRSMASQSTDYYDAPNAQDLAKVYKNIALSIKTPIGATNLTLQHTFDPSAFQLVPNSFTPSGVMGANTITWSLPAVPDGTQVFSYKLTPRVAGRFNVDQGDRVTFSQCENIPENIALPAGLPVTITPPTPTPTPTRTPTPPATFTPFPTPQIPPAAGAGPLDAVCNAFVFPYLWIPCLLLPLLIALVLFLRWLAKQREREPKKRNWCPLALWAMIPFLLIILWLIINQILNNVCLGRESLYFWRVDPNGVSGIFVTNPDGTRPARPFAQVNQVSKCVGCHAVSNASRRIAVVQDGPGGPLAIFGLDGKQTPLLEGIRVNYLSWSPDGSKIAASTDQQIIVVINADTGEVTPLFGANDPNYSQIMPAWSPDGSAIAFVRSKDRSVAYLSYQPADIYVVPATGGVALPLSGASGSGYNYYPSYSPDGKWIAFTRHITGTTTYSDPNAEIYILPSSGGTPRRLQANDAPDGRHLTRVSNSWPAWSRDGKQIAFNSKRNGGQYDIFIAQINDDGTSGPARILASASDSTLFEHLPFWGEPPQIDLLTGVLDLWPWFIPPLFLLLLYFLCGYLHKPAVAPPPRPVVREREGPQPLEPVFLPNTWQVTPTLVLGIGGTGRWVLTHLKKNLRDSGMGKLPDQVRFLLLDTAEREETNVLRDPTGKPLRVEFAGEYLDPIEILLLRGNLESLVRAVVEGNAGTDAYDIWFPAEKYRQVAPNTLDLSNGTQGRRPLARAGLIKGVIEEDQRAQTSFLLWKFLIENCRQVMDEGRVRVVIAGSIAGGMSGILFDLAYLARMASKSVVPKEGSVSVEAYLAGPGVFANSGGNGNQRQVNAFATMRELERFQLSKARTYPMRYRSTGALPLEGVLDTPIFDDVYLFGSGGHPESHDGKSAQPWATVFASMADVVSMRIDRGIRAGSQLDYRGNVQTQVSNLQLQSNRAYLGSAGTFIHRLPLYNIVDQITTRWARQLLYAYVMGAPAESASGGDSAQLAEQQVTEFLEGQFGAGASPAGMEVIAKLTSGLVPSFSRTELASIPDTNVGVQPFRSYLQESLGLVLNGTKDEHASAERIKQAAKFLDALVNRLTEAERTTGEYIPVSKSELARALERVKKLAEQWRVIAEQLRAHLLVQRELLEGRTQTATQKALVGTLQKLGDRETTVRAQRAQMDQVGVREYLWWRVRDPVKPATDPKNQIDIADEWYLQRADPKIKEHLPRFVWKFDANGEPRLGLVSFKGSDIRLTEQTIDQFVEELLRLGTYVVQDIWKEITLTDQLRARRMFGSATDAVESATRMWRAANPHLQTQQRDKRGGAAFGVPSALRHAAPDLAQVYEELGGVNQRIPSALNPTRTVVAELTDQFATGLIRTLDFVSVTDIQEIQQARRVYERTLTEAIGGVESAELETVFAAERQGLEYERRLSDPSLYRLPLHQLHPLVLVALENLDRARLYALAYAAGWIPVGVERGEETTVSLLVPNQTPQKLATKRSGLHVLVEGLLNFCQETDQKVINALQFHVDNPSDETSARWREYYVQWKEWQGTPPMSDRPQEVQDFGAIAAIEVYDRLVDLKSR